MSAKAWFAASKGYLRRCGWTPALAASSSSTRPPTRVLAMEDAPELVMHLRIPSSRTQYVQRTDGEHRITYRNGQLVEHVLLKRAPHSG